AERAAISRLGFFQPARAAVQVAQVEVAGGQVLTEGGLAGEFVDQSLWMVRAWVKAVSACSGRPVVPNKPHRLTWVAARSLPNPGRSRKSSANCFLSSRAFVRAASASLGRPVLLSTLPRLL